MQRQANDETAGRMQVNEPFLNMDTSFDQQIVDLARDQGERLLDKERRSRRRLNERDVVKVGKCFAFFRGHLDNKCSARCNDWRARMHSLAVPILDRSSCPRAERHNDTVRFAYAHRSTNSSRE